MSMYNVDVFISHSWTYSEHYEKLYEWIFDRSCSTTNPSPKTTRSTMRRRQVRWRTPYFNGLMGAT